MKKTLTALAAVAACALACPAAAQGYPAKPAKILVGYAAGGPTDVIARIVAQDMTQSLGQSFVVENRPGANAIIATQAGAPPPPAPPPPAFPPPPPPGEPTPLRGQVPL